MFGLQGPLSYVLRKDATVAPEVDDPLTGDDYFGVSGGLIQEMTARIPLSGSLYKSDNKTVYLHLYDACKGTSCESTVKATGRQDGRAAYMALMDHHAGDEKYMSIANNLMHRFNTWKWNGRSSSMERHVSKHRQCYEALHTCKANVTVMVPGEALRKSAKRDASTEDGLASSVISISFAKGQCPRARSIKRPTILGGIRLGVPPPKKIEFNTRSWVRAAWRSNSLNKACSHISVSTVALT